MDGARCIISRFGSPALEHHMTLCPVALAIGCRKCPIVRMCPVKDLIGDYKPQKVASSKPRQGKGRQARR
jgi:hypothetical protein